MSLFTVPEAAAALRCSVRRVFELLADGTLIRGPRFGKYTVITAESVDAAMQPTEEAPAPRRRFRTRDSVEDWAALFDRHG